MYREFHQKCNKSYSRVICLLAMNKMLAIDLSVYRKSTRRSYFVGPPMPYLPCTILSVNQYLFLKSHSKSNLMRCPESTSSNHLNLIREQSLAVSQVLIKFAQPSARSSRLHAQLNRSYSVCVRQQIPQPVSSDAARHTEVGQHCQYLLANRQQQLPHKSPDSIAAVANLCCAK